MAAKNRHQIIHDGRKQAFLRLQAEAESNGGVGERRDSELRHFPWQYRIPVQRLDHSCRNQGSRPGGESNCASPPPTTRRKLFRRIDSAAIKSKLRFAGNVAYFSGYAAGGIRAPGRWHAARRSEIFQCVQRHTRHLALQRVVRRSGAAHGANSVVGITTTVMPFQGVHEMMMMGTAAHNPALPAGGLPVTSDLTSQEMWNLAAMGYAPIKLVLGTAVYSLGVVGGMMAALKSFSRGEINELTSLIYDAREHAIGLIRDEAAALGADDVVGIKIHVHDLGKLLEFMAVGTAVKKIPGIGTQSQALPPQAIIVDKTTPGSPATGCSSIRQNKEQRFGARPSGRFTVARNFDVEAG